VVRLLHVSYEDALLLVAELVDPSPLLVREYQNEAARLAAPWVLENRLLEIPGE
jgi:hypothetical protein